MANRDLRDWIEGVRAAGELKVITGAEPKEEIGGICAQNGRKICQKVSNNIQRGAGFTPQRNASWRT